MVWTNGGQPRTSSVRLLNAQLLPRQLIFMPYRRHIWLHCLHIFMSYACTAVTHIFCPTTQPAPTFRKRRFSPGYPKSAHVRLQKGS
ncbi:hypothetical protein CDAR_479531 [Caerostris darwini]|uniref:Uncharacterized protein n=1 Tax=Caerostris darwini TaxID=1538125 RepID=A0AAV4MTH7_9ARAC|nr:hypothetical protein CDAR_479531 [Caerostris darwini]